MAYGERLKKRASESSWRGAGISGSENSAYQRWQRNRQPAPAKAAAISGENHGWLAAA